MSSSLGLSPAHKIKGNAVERLDIVEANKTDALCFHPLERELAIIDAYGKRRG